MIFIATPFVFIITVMYLFDVALTQGVYTYFI